jgi:hypothetical protein
MAHTITTQILESGDKFVIAKYNIKGDAKDASEFKAVTLFDTSDFIIPPQGSTFFATFKSDLNGNYGGGTLTGTPQGSAAIANGQLDLNYSDWRYVDFDAKNNADSQQKGAIKFKVTPNYAGAPLADHSFINECKADSASNNMIDIMHHSGDAKMVLTAVDKNNALVFQTPIGVWNPVAGTEYEMELDYDFTTGATRFFIEGVQLGSTIVSTLLRDSNIGLFRVGSNYDHTHVSNFYIKDVVVFSDVQHTVDYIPGYTLYNFIPGKTDDKLFDIEYCLNNFSAELFWDANANVSLLTLIKDYPYKDCFIIKEGGLRNNAGTGKTRNILITTNGLAGSSYDGHIILRVSWM